MIKPAKRRQTSSVALCFTAIILFGGAGAMNGEAPMSAKIMNQSSFTVIGIEARTNNAKEASGNGVIGKQWTRFMKESLLDKIPHRIDSSIIALYTEYASDRDGDYTYVLGAQVSPDAKIPQGMVAKKVPAGQYAVFTSEKGPAPRVVPEAWQRIYSVPRSAPGGNRAYATDFEIYDERAADPQNAQVDIYIGIK